MSELYSILQNYCPEEGRLQDHLANIVNDNLEEVLADLPRIGFLPMPETLNEVEEITQTCPVVIEEAISIAALRRHLWRAAPDTPEIGITIFENGTQVLEVGTIEGVRSDLAWKPFEERGTIIFHTHPDPSQAELMRNPSIGDVTNTIILGKSTAISSHDGLTHVPKPEVTLDEHTGYSLWGKYVTGRDLNDVDRYEAYGPNRLYDDFVRDAIKARFSAWDQLDEKATLADTILSQQESLIHPTTRF